MANIQNISVEKHAGGSIEWSGLVGSSGDKTPAIWRSQSVGSAVSHRPEYKLATFDSQSGKQRIAKVNVVFPVLATVEGVSKVVDYNTFTGEFKMSKNASDADIGEFVHQTIALNHDSVIRSAIKVGFAPT